MTVTQKATVKVDTDSFRFALAACTPHAKRTKKGDDLVMHRVRLTLANGWLFVTAANGKTTAQDRIKYIPDGDTRGNLWEPDDGPMVVDLSPDKSRLMQQWLSAKAVGDDVDKIVAITVDLVEGEVEFEAIGTTNEGERHVLPMPEASDLFPDVVEISGRALAEAAGESERARTLVQDAALLDLFKAAGVQYKAALRLRQTGTAEAAGGFVVECGPTFVGTIASDNGGDEGKRRHAQYTQETLLVLKPRKLASA